MCCTRRSPFVCVSTTKWELQLDHCIIDFINMVIVCVCARFISSSQQLGSWQPVS